MESSVEVERWPLREAFTIARGSKTEAVVVVVTLEHGAHAGRGEAVPYARYGETPEGVVEAIREALARGLLDREALRAAMPAGAARNALDLALWDLARKRGEVRVEGGAPVLTAYTLPIRSVDETRELAARHAWRPLLKVKLGAQDDLARIEVVREAAPGARLIADANEGWDLETLKGMAPRLADLGVELLEQPLPAASDAALASFDSPVPLCADESFVGDATVDSLSARYAAINVKLDKQGGLTAAIDAVRRARELELEVMVGSMVATSLAVAPAVELARDARWADVDAPLLLARDREPGLRFEGSLVFPPSPALWG